MNIQTYKQAEWADYKANPIDSDYLERISEIYRRDCLIPGEYPNMEAFCKICDSIGGSLLDIGCNTGDQYDTMEVLSPNIQYLTGVELHPDLLNNAKLRHPEIEWVLVDNFLILPFQDNSYDIVTLRSVIDKYFPENGLKVLNEAYRVTKKALVFKFVIAPKDNTEVKYWQRGTENFGYTVQWTQKNLDIFLDGKKFEKYQDKYEWAIYTVTK